MNQDDKYFVLGFCVFSFFTLSLCCSCYIRGEVKGRQKGYDQATENFRKELIAKGFAEYNATNGVWQYKTKIP